MEVGTKTATGDDDGVGTNAHPPAHKVGQVLVALLIYHGHKLQTAQCSRAKRRKREHVMLYDRSGDALQSEGVDSSPPPHHPLQRKMYCSPTSLWLRRWGPGSGDACATSSMRRSAWRQPHECVRNREANTEHVRQHGKLKSTANAQVTSDSTPHRHNTIQTHTHTHHHHRWQVLLTKTTHPTKVFTVCSPLHHLKDEKAFAARVL